MTQKTVSAAFEDHLATLNNNKLIYEIKTSYECLSNREKKIYKLGFSNGYQRRIVKSFLFTNEEIKKPKRNIAGFSFSKPKSFVIESIINKVCVRYEINKKELMINRSRRQDMCRARNILFNLLYEKYNLSLTRIGEIFGNDHTTVLHGIKMKKDKRRFWSQDQTLWKEFEEIKSTIT
jgi:chromosomal replication initiation ATPase DnaA